MRPIPLTRGFMAIVDDEDSHLAGFKWCASISRPNKDGRVRVYAVRQDSGVRFALHREVAGNPSCDVDHVDGDTLNCRRGNLRAATRAQNNANVGKRRGASRYKGVHFSRDTGKWCAQIKKRHLGVFMEECDAATAYNFAAAEEYGEFARFNL